MGFKNTKHLYNKVNMVSKYFSRYQTCLEYLCDVGIQTPSFYFLCYDLIFSCFSFKFYWIHIFHILESTSEMLSESVYSVIWMICRTSIRPVREICGSS